MYCLCNWTRFETTAAHPVPWSDSRASICIKRVCVCVSVCVCVYAVLRNSPAELLASFTHMTHNVYVYIVARADVCTALGAYVEVFCGILG